MALGRYLDLNPGRSNESPSWLGIALWAEGYTGGKPDEASVARAVGELDRRQASYVARARPLRLGAIQRWSPWRRLRNNLLALAAPLL